MTTKVSRTPAAPAAMIAQSDVIFVRDHVVACSVGVYAEEHGVKQTVRFTVEATMTPGVHAVRDDIAEVPSYTDIIDAIQVTADGGHIELLETFAERVAQSLLADGRIAAVRVRLEKLERGPLRGVEIVRARAAH